jgi:rubrerythrin
MNTKQFEELVLQSLEHERGGVQVYTAALECAVRPDLRDEWQRYLEQTRSHVAALEQVCRSLGLDAERETPGRTIVRFLGEALVQAMKKALGADRNAAELVACECVVLAETKDHLDWELLGKCSEELTGPRGEPLAAAYEEIEEQEDEHLYHTRGWCRELWLESLGLSAVLPPPEERQQVRTAVGAAKAEQSAERMR